MSNEFIDFVQNKAEDFSDALKFTGDCLREEFTARNDKWAKSGISKDAQSLLGDMKNKGLFDGNLPKLDIAEFSNDGQTQATLKDGTLAVKYGNRTALSVSKPGEFAAMQWNNPGGKVTEFHDKNSDAMVVEPRDGGSLVLDRKERKLTITNAKGERFVEDLSKEPKKEKETIALMESIRLSNSFDIDWTNKQHFSVRIFPKH